MADDSAHDSITPTGASLVSMFETNSLAMHATPATIAATRLNDSAVVLLEGIDWAGA